MVYLRAKVIIIGDATVGKTSICQMLGSDGSVFPKNYSFTVMTDLIVKPIPIGDNNDTIELFMNDCSGKEMYFEHVKETWLNADMVCIVYDITNKETLKHVGFWYEKVKQFFENSNKKIIGVLVGNKSDLENRRAMPQSQAKQIAESNHLKYFECSAKEYNGLLEPFKYLATQYLNKYNDKIDSIKNMTD